MPQFGRYFPDKYGYEYVDGRADYRCASVATVLAARELFQADVFRRRDAASGVAARRITSDDCVVVGVVLVSALLAVELRLPCPVCGIGVSARRALLARVFRIGSFDGDAVQCCFGRYRFNKCSVGPSSDVPPVLELFVYVLLEP